MSNTRITSSGTLPATCSVGGVYTKTGTGAGLYVCLATNVWTGPLLVSGGAGVGGADFYGSGHPQGVVTAVGGQTYRDTTNGVLYVKMSLASTAWGWYRIDWSPYSGNSIAAIVNPATASSIPGIGMTTPTVTLGNGSTTNEHYAGGTYQALLTGTTAAAGPFVLAAEGPLSNLNNWDITFIVGTDPSSLANTRIFVGVSDNNAQQLTTTDTMTQNGWGFRYSTVAGDGGWVAIAYDGTQSVSATVGSIAIDTFYKLRIRHMVGGTLYFSVNDGPETTVTSHVYTTPAEFAVEISISNTVGGGGTARTLKFARLWGWVGIDS